MAVSTIKTPTSTPRTNAGTGYHLVWKEAYDALARGWDAAIAAALPLVPSLPQPLWALVNAGEKSALEAALAGRAPIPSCRTNRAP